MVDATFVRIAHTGETDQMGHNEIEISELEIQHATGTTGYLKHQNYRQQQIRKVQYTGGIGSAYQVVQVAC